MFDLPTILFPTILYFRKVQFEEIPSTYMYFPFFSEKEVSLMSPVLFQNQLALGFWKIILRVSDILTPQSEIKWNSLNLCAQSRTHTQTDADIHVLCLAEIHTMGQKKKAKNERWVIFNSYCSYSTLTMEQVSLLDLFIQNWVYYNIT